MQSYAQFINEAIKYDIKGWGGTPNHQDVDYLGFRTKMSPDEYLALNPKRESPTPFVLDAMKKGEAIAPPMLICKREGTDFRVHGHEGRSRAMAAKILGEKSIPVFVVFSDVTRARHLTPAIIKAAKFLPDITSS